MVWGVTGKYCSGKNVVVNILKSRGFKEIDVDLTRILDHPSYDELKKEGESLKERVKVAGSSAASVMYFFGKK